MLWKETCNLKKTDDVSHLCICSWHFVEDDFNNPKAEEYGELLRLKANIVPSVNIPNLGKRTLTLSTIPVQMDVIEPQPSTSKEVELQMPVECTEKDVHSAQYFPSLLLTSCDFHISFYIFAVERSLE